MLKFGDSTLGRTLACNLVCMALLASDARPVAAMEQTILGHTLRVNDPKPGADPTLRKLYARAKEARSPNTIDGDPTANGATLEIRLNGSSPTSQTFSLKGGANGNGKPFWHPIADGFAYRDYAGENGPVKALRINQSEANGLFTISARLSGKKAALDLVPPASGTDASMVLSILGGGGIYCVQYGPEGNVRNRADKSFQVGHPELEGCPRCTAPPGLDDGDASACADAESGTTCLAWACNEGYVASGTDPRCTAGTWTGTYACEPVPCDTEPEIEKASSTCSGTESGESCSTWSCDAGYVRRGGNPSCTLGTWSGDSSCAPAPCNTEPVIAHGFPACRGTPSGETCDMWACPGVDRVKKGSDPLCTLGTWSGTYRCEKRDGPPR